LVAGAALVWLFAYGVGLCLVWLLWAFGFSLIWILWFLAFCLWPFLEFLLVY
jgi:hypothetical protein